MVSKQLTQKNLCDMDGKIVTINFPMFCQNFTGMISVEGTKVYFLSNDQKMNGSRPRDMHGYTCGWSMGNITADMPAYQCFLPEGVTAHAPGTIVIPTETKPASLQEERAKLVARIAEIDEALEEDREEDYPEELF